VKPLLKKAHPVLKIPLVTRIANATVGLTGLYGDVARQAEVADCSRQAIYDHARKVQAAVEDAHAGGPTRATSIAENEQLRQENARLWDWLAQTIEFPPDKQRQFTVTAAAMGLSLNQVLALLALVLGARACPGRSTLHRWIKAAGLMAGRVLKSLDAKCQALVLVGCLDEIFFHGRPVLVGVEPASMAWSLGQKADDRSGATWAKALRDWTALAYVTADAGTGLRAGIAAVHQERQKAGKPSLENGLDVFRTTYEARRVLRSSWNRVEHLRERAEVADRRVERSQRQGQDARGAAVAARCAWKKAAVAFAEYERSAAGWKRARPGAAPVVGSRVVQGARLPSDRRDVDVPGPPAPSVARSGPRGSVAYGIGTVVVAAPAAAPSEHPGRCGECRPCGASGATGGLPEGGRELAGVVRGRVAGVATDGACQQCGGVHEQRAADAPVATSDGDPGAA
jgi:hypothetical protein